MAGHNKWSSIKRKKGATDAKRGKLFSRISKEIAVASREGGGNQDGNPRLRTALLAARAANMPKDNMDRAIKRGTGEIEGAVYESIVYEGYTAGGAAVYVEALTDNKNRAAGEIRHAFSRFGGNLGEPGSVTWMFSPQGLIVFEEGITEEQAFEVALEAGALDVEADNDSIEVYTELVDFENVKEAFEKAGFKYSEAELAQIPSTTLELSGKDVDSAVKLLEALDDLDDVQKVWSNLDFDDKELAELN